MSRTTLSVISMLLIFSSKSSVSKKSYKKYDFLTITSVFEEFNLVIEFLVFKDFFELLDLPIELVVVILFFQMPKSDFNIA